MARRQGNPPPLSSSRSSKSQFRSTEERRNQNESSGRTIRLWIFLLIATFLIFERATVFAAPAPKGLAKAALSYINTTISRNTQPIPPSEPTNHRHKNNSNSAQQQVSIREPTNSLQSHQQVSSHHPANVAFFLQIAENTVNHLPRLLRAIYHEENVYAIHLDLKIPPHRVKAIVDKIHANPHYRQNVYIMDSELITYRGISMLLNTISAIRLLLENNHSWHYFVNLSGADYPLLTPQTIRTLLGYQLGLNFFTFAPKRTWDGMAENRLAQYWYDESLTFRKSPSVGALTQMEGRNPLVDDRQFDVSHAEAWMIASREFCQFVITGDMSRKMLVAFAYAVDSSEHYFASLAWNHPQFKKSLVPHSLRMIIWLYEGVLSGQHPYFIDQVTTNGDYKFKKEISTSVLFFARKFGRPDSELMDWIDERAKGKEIIAAAQSHIVRKITSRAARLAEL